MEGLKWRNPFYWFLSLQPVFFLAGVRLVLSPSAGSWPGTVLFGLLMGGLLAAAYPSSLPDRLNGGFLLLFLSPAPLLFAGIVPAFSSVGFWMLFPAVYTLLWLGLLLFFNKGIRRDSKTALIVGALSFLFLLLFFLSEQKVFSPDSYSYYDISRSLFKDFGRVNTIRQYLVFSDYNLSFPYLYPSLISLVDRTAGFGMQSGVVVNVAAAAATLFLLPRISHRVSGSYLPGSLVAGMLFLNQYYRRELQAARAIPVAFFFVLLAVYALLQSREKGKGWFWLAGFAVGCGTVVRFDVVVFAAFCGLLLLLMGGKQRWGAALRYVGGALLPVLPWVVYSLRRFGTPWASDNSSTLLLVETRIPQRFFLPGETVRTLFSDPAGWGAALVVKASNVLQGLFSCFQEAGGFWFLGLLLIALLVALLRKKNPLSRRDRGLLWLSGAFLLLKTAFYALVGYRDARYHVESLFLLFLFLACALWHWLPKTAVWRGAAAVILCSILIPSAMTSYESSPWKQGERLWESSVVYPQEAFQSEYLTVLENMVYDSTPEGETPRVFFLSGPSYSFGAFTGVTTYCPLDNPTPQRLLYLTRQYIKPTHLYADRSQAEWLMVLRRYYHLEKVYPNYSLYRVTPLAEETGEEGLLLGQ